jgi:hypothetical protein
MLLTDLVKHTWDSHPDIDHLRGALVKIKETADFVNDSKRRSENRARLLEIQTLIGMKMFIPTREIIQEVDLIKLTGKKEKESRKPISCCLMNDSILLWKPIGTKSGKSSLFTDLESVKLSAETEKQGDVVENILVIRTGKKEVKVAMAPTAKLTPDQFCEKVVKLRANHAPSTPPPPNKSGGGGGKEKEKGSEKEKEKDKEKDSTPRISLFKSKDSESSPSSSSSKRDSVNKDGGKSPKESGGSRRPSAATTSSSSSEPTTRARLSSFFGNKDEKKK